MTTDTNKEYCYLNHVTSIEAFMRNSGILKASIAPHKLSAYIYCRACMERWHNICTNVSCKTHILLFLAMDRLNLHRKCNHKLVDKGSIKKLLNVCSYFPYHKSAKMTAPQSSMQPRQMTTVILESQIQCQKDRALHREHIVTQRLSASYFENVSKIEKCM